MARANKSEQRIETLRRKEIRKIKYSAAPAKVVR